MTTAITNSQLIREYILFCESEKKGKTNTMTTEKKEVVKDVEILHQGTQIILPVINGKQMEYDEAIKWLTRKKEEDEKTVMIYNNIPCSPLDGAVAFHRALTEQYGFVQGIPTKSFFGEQPPVMIRVPIGNGETIQVPWGRMQVPGIEGVLMTGMEADPSPCFLVGGEVKKKCRKQVEELIQLTEKYLKEKSIYKGQAVKISFAYERTDSDGDRVRGYDPIQDAPQFMTLDPDQENNLIFGEEVQRQLTIGLFTPIEYKDACRKYQIPLKRGVLLYGPYGVGKTLTANVTALKAKRNGWTFIYLDTVQDLQRGLQFAAQYAPAILFAEDIDRVVHGHRTMEMDEILNTLDGIDTKNGEIITVFTTNHVENINPAILRMGRLDSLIEVLPPDATAAKKLISLYARQLLAPDTTLDAIGERLAGKIPAFIREVTERAKMAAIYRLGGGDIEGHVVEQDLLDAASAMEAHDALIWPKKTKFEDQPELLVRVPAGHKHAQTVLAEFTTNGAAQ